MPVHSKPPNNQQQRVVGAVTQAQAQGNARMPLQENLQPKLFYDVWAYRYPQMPGGVHLIGKDAMKKLSDVYMQLDQIEPWWTTGPVNGSSECASFFPYILPFVTDDNTFLRPVKLPHLSFVCYVWDSKKGYAPRPQRMDSKNQFFRLNYRIRPCTHSLLGNPSKAPLVLACFEFLPKEYHRGIKRMGDPYVFQKKWPPQARAQLDLPYNKHGELQVSMTDTRFSVNTRCRKELRDVLDALHNTTSLSNTVYLLILETKDVQLGYCFHLVYPADPGAPDPL